MSADKPVFHPRHADDALNNYARKQAEEYDNPRSMHRLSRSAEQGLNSEYKKLGVGQSSEDHSVADAGSADSDSTNTEAALEASNPGAVVAAQTTQAMQAENTDMYEDQYVDAETAEMHWHKRIDALGRHPMHAPIRYGINPRRVTPAMRTVLMSFAKLSKIERNVMLNCLDLITVSEHQRKIDEVLDSALDDMYGGAHEDAEAVATQLHENNAVLEQIVHELRERLHAIEQERDEFRGLYTKTLDNRTAQEAKDTVDKGLAERGVSDKHSTAHNDRVAEVDDFDVDDGVIDIDDPQEDGAEFGAQPEPQSQVEAPDMSAFDAEVPEDDEVDDEDVPDEFVTEDDEAVLAAQAEQEAALMAQAAQEEQEQEQIAAAVDKADKEAEAAERNS